MIETLLAGRATCKTICLEGEKRDVVSCKALAELHVVSPNGFEGNGHLIELKKTRFRIH